MKSEAEIRAGLERLSPEIPWAHYYNLGGVETVSREKDEKFFRKSRSLLRIGEIALATAKHTLRHRTLEQARFLDIAPAEGAHSIEIARAGVGEVLGIEGRELYVRRASFAAECLGMTNVRFKQGDVRRIDPVVEGSFDFVLCSGILHHLGKDDFAGFIRLLSRLTADTCLLYTHVSNPQSVQRFRLQPTPPAEGRYAGNLFREHKDTASEQQRRDKVRASLDNTFSFWAEQESLVRALVDVGFSTIEQLLHPHAHEEWEERTTRIILVCRK